MRRRLAIAAALPHADPLQTLALRLAPHPADTADIVQDTYLRAFAAWQQRRPDDDGHGPHGGGGARRHHHPGPATTPHPARRPAPLRPR
jgi:sigma-70-like protein